MAVSSTARREALGRFAYALPAIGWALVLLGVMIAVVLEMSGIPSLAFAVGVYLPLSSSAPIFATSTNGWSNLPSFTSATRVWRHGCWGSVSPDSLPSMRNGELCSKTW